MSAGELDEVVEEAVERGAVRTKDSPIKQYPDRDPVLEAAPEADSVVGVVGTAGMVGR
jgi:hypothetical protein